MEQLSSNHHRFRLLRLAGGVTAVFIVLGRLVEHAPTSTVPTATGAFIWATTFMVVILLVWREKNLSKTNHQAHEERARFIGVAETSPNAFVIFDSVRDQAGEIVDFQFVYVNSHGEKLLKAPRARLLRHNMCVVFPELHADGSFDKYCRVVQSGEALSEDFSSTLEDGSEVWLRRRTIKLGDGVAVTTSDVTEIKQKEVSYQNLSSFSKSVFEHAPFSIVEMDLNGTIQEVNSATERLTGYSRADLVGVASIELLHDTRELNPGTGDGNEAKVGVFQLITARAAQGEVEERESTYVRRDGSTLPVHLAITAIRDNIGGTRGFVAIASDISERKQMMSYLGHMASHDQLTGLPGRTLLRERIAEAIEKATLNDRKVAVFVIDFDQFKRINDSLGHRSGDELLIGMAERVRHALRRSDTLGRLGGDEFVVIMPHIAGIADVERCAKRLVERVAGAGMIGDFEVNLTASVGVCVFPDFADDPDSLLDRADAAMYAAKESGRNQYQMFTQAMLQISQDRLSMDTALRHALQREELFLNYQPIVSLTTGRVIGLEALLRWLHPKLGMISPASFVPLAEETGLIIPIGEWALKQSCIDGKLLSDQLGRDLSVSVNLSPRQFEQTNLLGVIEEALEASGLPASQLQVELTENTLMINSASNLEKLQRIRQMGARIAIDDFGTGFCSFSYLLQYPVDRLKIDQSFIAKSITEPNAATVVRTIIAMSHHLGIKVIAEGIETVDQLNFLLRRNSDEAQGYYFSRPVAASRFAEAATFIHRLFDEHKLLEDAQPCSDGSADRETGEDDLDVRVPAFQRYHSEQIAI